MSKKIKKTKNSQLHTPHDKLFKRSMKIPAVAKEFLFMHLPNNIKHTLDYSTLEALPETFIDETLGHAQVDALFKVQCDQQELLIYILVEQQTKPDLTMPTRRLSYKSDIWASYLESHKNLPNATLPPIIDLHFYTGIKPYTGPLSLAELAKDNADLINQCLIQPMINIWAGDITDEQLKTHPWAATLEYIMHNRRAQDLRSVLHAIAPNIRMFYIEGQNQFVLSLYTYIENVYTYEAPIEELARIAGEEISPQAKDDMMTIAEQMRHRGIEQGIKQGIEQGIEQGKRTIAERMLSEGSNPAFIMKVTGLSLDKIQALQRKV